MAIGIFVRQSSPISGGQAEVAKPESELYERERGQTKKSQEGSDRYLHQESRTLVLFPPPLLIWSLGWGVAATGARKGEFFGGCLDKSFDFHFFGFLHS